MLQTDRGQVFLFSPTKLALVPFRALLRTVMVEINCTTVVFSLQMVEVMEGIRGILVPPPAGILLSFKSWPGYINASIDIFFNQQVLPASSALGNAKKSKNGSTHQVLKPLIIQTLIGKFYWIQIQYPFLWKCRNIQLNLSFNFLERVFTPVNCMLNLQKSILSGLNTFWSIHKSKWVFFSKAAILTSLQ